MFTLLTKSGGPLGPIASVLGLIMNAIYTFFNLFGIQNIALTIIVFTFITKTLMLPLTIKQQKFTKLSSRMNPEIQKIQAKYKGKKDEASLKKQQAETSVVYQKYGASPTSGCLPLLITLPIMFALYQVINNIPAYVTLVRQMYEPIANNIMNSNGYVDALTTVSKGLARVKLTDLSTTNRVIDVLSKFNTEYWDKLTTTIPDITAAITPAMSQINRVNSFLGLNIINPPGWRFPGIIIPLLAMGLQFVQSKQLNIKGKDGAKDNPAASAMSSMNVVMPIMSGVFCIALPIGIGLYWIATSLFAIVQQYFVNKYMDKIDVEELIEKNVMKASKKPSRLRTAAGTQSLQELAKKQTKSIESIATEKKKYSGTDTNEKKEEADLSADESVKENPASKKPTSISEIANLMKNRNSEKGDK